MKIKLLQILLIFFLWISGSICYAQEICNNGIDDDGDGLIDLNDRVDCACTLSKKLVSLIPNPSFEEKTDCPFTTSQIDYAAPWFNNTNGTTDYMNACGHKTRAATSLGLFPFPDGDACAGAYIYEGYTEYLTTCLDSTLKAGTAYNLVFDVAHASLNTNFNSLLPACADSKIYPPFELTLYGLSTCSKTIIKSYLCPSASNPNWKIIGKVMYQPKSRWIKASIQFEPTFDIKAIMLGAPCTLPAGYEMPPGTFCYPYFYFDNLVLNTLVESKTPRVKIEEQGSICT